MADEHARLNYPPKCWQYSLLRKKQRLAVDATSRAGRQRAARLEGRAQCAVGEGTRRGGRPELGPAPGTRTPGIGTPGIGAPVVGAPGAGLGEGVGGGLSNALRS